MTEPGLRERKKQETRAALCRATLDLALRDGYDAVTVDAIAAWVTKRHKERMAEINLKA